VRSLLREAAGSLLSIVFPSACSLCQEELSEFSSTGVCRACWDSLEPWQGPVCSGCGLPLPSDQLLESAEWQCADCRTQETAFDRARNFGLYRENLRAILLQLKFHHRERLGTRLGELLVPVCRSMVDPSDTSEVLVVPVPLHSTRQRERGYNQAELLARGLVGAYARSRQPCALRIEHRALRKTRPTPPQTGLSWAERRDNVRGAFTVVSPERVRDRVVILVDDVMTTGATLSACASALKQAGVRQVLGLTLARATPQFPDGEARRGPADIDDSRPKWP